MTHDSTTPPIGVEAALGDATGDDSISQAGYSQQFARTLGRFESFAVAFSFISITTGLFSTYGVVLANGGPTGIWTWPIVTVGTLCVALIYGMLSSRIPLSGYSYQWSSRLASPLIGWWFGWLSFAFLAMATVAVDYSLTQVALFPLFGIEYSAGRGALVTVVVILIQMALIIWSTPITTKINNIAVGAEVIAMVGLTVLIGAAVIFGDSGTWSNLTSEGAAAGSDYWAWLGPFMLSALLGAFTLVGWESAANLAEETHNPKQVIPRAMIRAILISGVIGMLFLIVITVGIGDDVSALTNNSAPVAAIIENILGEGAAKATLAVVVIAIFACGLVIMVSNSRLIYAMARDNRLPASGMLREVPRATGGPIWSTVLAASTSLLIVVSFSNDSEALAQLLGAATILPAILYGATVALFLVTRRKWKPQADDFQLGKWEAPVIVVAVVWVVLELSIFLIPDDFRSAQKYALGAVALGAVLFVALLLTRRESLQAEVGAEINEL